jgi:hypothetical protein
MITLNDARPFIAAAEKKSAEIGQAMNIRHRIWLKPIHDFSYIYILTLITSTTKQVPYR